MLIKANPTKKEKADFQSPDATEEEIKEFVEFLNVGGTEKEEINGKDVTNDSGKSHSRSSEAKKKRS